MGSMGAIGMAAAVDEGQVDIRGALHWHLTANHFPPIPAECVESAVRAIDKANAGAWNTRVRLPDGVTWRGSKLAPVSAVVDDWHLDAFLDPPNDDDGWAS